MLKPLDLIIIEGFLEKHIDLFKSFCINECVGSEGTGFATLKHVQDALVASQPGVEADAESRCDYDHSLLKSRGANYCEQNGQRVFDIADIDKLENRLLKTPLFEYRVVRGISGILFLLGVFIGIIIGVAL